MTGTRPRAGSLRGWVTAVVLVLVLPAAGCGGPRVSAPVEARTVGDEPAARTKPAPGPGGHAATPPGPREQGDWRPESYAVRKGDTLYAIALDHGLDYRELATWNGLTDPNLIRVDQKLRLHAPPAWQPPPEPAAGPAVVSQPLPPPPEIETTPLPPLAVKTAPKAVKVAYSDAALAQLRGEPLKPAGAAAPSARPEIKPVAAAKPPSVGPVMPPSPTALPPAAADKPTPAAVDAHPGADWMWPTNGPVLHAFNQGVNPKGVAIGGEPGQPILASAPGKVVYSGSGLRGYGKLIIIKHNDTYLSVYAHNKTLLVKEGERVAKGQKIAEMGDSDAQRASLHFEIRRLGKPVDPLQYLPESRAS